MKNCRLFLTICAAALTCSVYAADTTKAFMPKNGFGVSLSQTNVVLMPYLTYRMSGMTFGATVAADKMVASGDTIKLISAGLYDSITERSRGFGVFFRANTASLSDTLSLQLGFEYGYGKFKGTMDTGNLMRFSPTVGFEKFFSDSENFSLTAAFTPFSIVKARAYGQVTVKTSALMAGGRIGVNYTF
ncbi:MAG: hypothetical protein H8E74_07805 [Gammaproteobacteria bacterium]|nr:hypothetical protein [Gammaproteobacteria bacterium]